MAQITGTDGTDLLSGGDSADTILGLGGDDQINGGGGNDTIDGGSGNDLITGGAGTDTLTGGTGADTFRDTAAGLNADTITDFLPGDRIQIVDLPLQSANIQIVGSTITYNGGSITIGNGLAPGRLVLRALGTQGVEIRLQGDAHNDFNGDGKSDVLWLNDSGSVGDWLGQAGGGFVGNANFGATVPTSFHVAGTGDFNGDGRVDVLWRNDAGTVGEWLGQPNGGFAGNAANVNITVDNSWHVVSTGDFNGDGLSDVLWRNDVGTVGEWLGQSNGGFVGNAANVNITVDPSWHIVGTGDFNGDGVDDILWRNDVGTVGEWLGQSNGGFAGNAANVNITVDNSWHIVATADFNGDGLSDVLWRNDVGTVGEWLGQSNGGFAGNAANVNITVDPSWHIVATGDFNGDAIDDVLWRNNAGTVGEWLGQSNGGFVGNAANVNVTMPTNWHVQDPFVHDPFL